MVRLINGGGGGVSGDEVGGVDGEVNGGGDGVSGGAVGSVVEAVV